MTDKDKQKFEDLADYIVTSIKYGMPVTKQDMRFLEAYNAMKKAQDAIAAGKPVPRAANAGRRKKIQTGYGNGGGN